MIRHLRGPLVFCRIDGRHAQRFDAHGAELFERPAAWLIVLRFALSIAVVLLVPPATGWLRINRGVGNNNRRRRSDQIVGSALRLLCASYAFVSLLTFAGSGMANEPGTAVMGAESRRPALAAAHRKPRRLPRRGRDWKRRLDGAIEWLGTGEHRSCAELKRRLGAPDPRSSSDRDLTPRRNGQNAEEILEYSATSRDDIGAGRTVLRVGCRHGKAAWIELTVRAS